MIPLVEHYCIKQSTDNIEHVLKTCNISRYTCKQCDIKTLKPFHKRGQCTYRRCDCKKNVRQTCPENEACGVIYDQIKAIHAFNDPNWLNTDSTMWSTCPWEQMKCYIATPGYKETKTICDADITALVQISSNNREINALIGTSSGYLDEIRKTRNEIYHSSLMTVSNDELKDIVFHAEICLKEVSTKFSDCRQEIDHQLSVLKRISIEKFSVTKQHESDAIDDAKIGIKDSLLALKSE
ncbi:hypothetical protein DPMN_037671 [Dreissena polymorpha]|uniref:Uncharacterized protein n=1 Tax=Dreissena polymorpha TaxID=45954 RepID=A0A9D4RQ21_DREPO|nr:hypothetical protein DPMN_037671 [Dreissena polymorpha]